MHIALLLKLMAWAYKRRKKIYSFIHDGLVKEKHMGLQDILAAAKDAQTAANDAVAKAQSDVDAAMPHLTYLASIESEIVNMPAEVGSKVHDALAGIKSLMKF